MEEPISRILAELEEIRHFDNPTTPLSKPTLFTPMSFLSLLRFTLVISQASDTTSTARQCREVQRRPGHTESKGR
jgi:hypothetical protein